MWNDRRLPGPCAKECPDRKADPNCHTFCEKYLAYRAEVDKLNAEKFEEKRKEIALKDIDKRRGGLFSEGMIGRRKR